jgi:bifunctional non-homologous end joining protein LigD
MPGRGVRNRKGGRTGRGSALAELMAKVRAVQLATLVKDVPPGAWVYELKWDGYRILAHKSGNDVCLMSRRGNDWTSEFSVVADAVAGLPTKECIIDGEVCAIGTNGVPSFQLLQNRGDRQIGLLFIVFDLLWVDGEDLRSKPLEERRARLEQIAAKAGADSLVRLSTAVEGDPKQILAAACKAGLEGIIAKQKGSRYVGARERTWLKVKCTLRQEFAVVGYLPLKKTLPAVGGLLLALKRDNDDALHYAGKVGTGFDDKTRVALAKLLDAHRSKTPTALGAPPMGRLARWSEPKYVAEVEFTEWTDAGDIRHPSFRGLRNDKKPEDCVRERPAAVEAADRSAEVHSPVPAALAGRPRRSSGKAARPTKADGHVVVAGVRVSHSDRVLHPPGVTKLELARYYERVGERMLPHVEGRPLTLLLWDPSVPERGGKFMRHAHAWGPDVLRRVHIQEKTKVGEYLVVDNVEGLVALAQMDVLEIHTWNSLAQDVERPNRVVFDLDPGPDVPWSRVVDCAHYLRDRLLAVKLASWPKTTGGKGVHIVVPIEPSADWAQCLEFTRAFADVMESERPKDFVTTLSKAKRSGRILIDYLRNNRTNTSIAAFSIRARPGAPVSMPVAWDEFDSSLKSDAFKMHDVAERLATARRDPWAGYFTRTQRLPIV